MVLLAVLSHSYHFFRVVPIFQYSSDDGPVMCFNAAKNFQLGWFDDKFEEINLSENFIGNLIGQADYSIDPSGTEKVGVRITGAADDYYVSFNRQTGNNAGTREGGNQVLVHSRAPGVDYAQSYLVAKLFAGQTYNIPGTNPPL